MQKTIEFVTAAHDGQLRKGTELPYIVHPMAVISLIGRWGITCPVTRKAALAHDVREERPAITPKVMADQIGDEAAAIVEELTFFPDPASPDLAHVQKEAYMASFDKKSAEALVIKIADRICNTEDFRHDRSTWAYAPKYWMKAKDLIATVYARKGEIEKRFSVDVFKAIDDSIKGVTWRT